MKTHYQAYIIYAYVWTYLHRTHTYAACYPICRYTHKQIDRWATYVRTYIIYHISHVIHHIYIYSCCISIYMHTYTKYIYMHTYTYTYIYTYMYTYTYAYAYAILGCPKFVLCPSIAPKRQAGMTTSRSNQFQYHSGPIK